MPFTNGLITAAMLTAVAIFQVSYGLWLLRRIRNPDAEIRLSLRAISCAVTGPMLCLQALAVGVSHYLALERAIPAESLASLPFVGGWLYATMAPVAIGCYLTCTIASAGYLYFVALAVIAKDLMGGLWLATFSAANLLVALQAEAVFRNSLVDYAQPAAAGCGVATLLIVSLLATYYEFTGDGQPGQPARRPLRTR